MLLNLPAYSITFKNDSNKDILFIVNSSGPGLTSEGLVKPNQSKSISLEPIKAEINAMKDQHINSLQFLAREPGEPPVSCKTPLTKDTTIEALDALTVTYTGNECTVK